MAYSVAKSYNYNNAFKNPPRNIPSTHHDSISIQFHEAHEFLYHVRLFFSLVGNGNPFQTLEKTSVLQEARTFNETPVNAKKCIHILTKILYLLNQVSNRMTFNSSG